MNLKVLHEGLGAAFTTVNGVAVVANYGDSQAEYGFIRRSAAICDLSCRTRICVTGNDRTRFLHGQVTNEISRLKQGQGCYAAITNAKGKMVADANIYMLADELLLDLEPGAASTVLPRLEKYIIADDVQLVDVSAQYGMFAILGPNVDEVLAEFGIGLDCPPQELHYASTSDRPGGDIYCVRHSRGAASGMDLFVPAPELERTFSTLVALSRARGGGAAGWEPIEIVRIEAGIPRFRQDMDESNLAPETGIEPRAISYSKGCYIGQEVIARIRTYGQVAKSLRGLKLERGSAGLPAPGDKLFLADKEVGYITSAVHSPLLGCPIALGYVRREHNKSGVEVEARGASGVFTAKLVDLPFVQ